MSARSKSPMQALLAALPGERSRDAADDPALTDAVDGLLEAAATAWPGIRMEPTAFLRHVASVLDAGRPAAEAIGELRAGDLFLAFAAKSGDRLAIEALERAHRPAMLAAIGRIRGAEPPEDLLQIARNRLFAGDARRGPAIGQYGGRGSLAAWIRVTTFNIAAKAARGKRLAIATYDGESCPEDLDPELEYLKRTYRGEFKEAFVEALETLAPRERTLLRQNVVHRLPVRRIATMYGVHHGTAARWIADAREQLVTETRAGLARRLRVDELELESIVEMVRSQLDLSLSRVLG
jgi:RNA polymerase sigma-70 factor (ECF subfamily)